MDLRYTDEEEAFRAELRAWLAEVLPGRAARAATATTGRRRRAYDTGWQRMLFDGGLRRHQLARRVRRPRRHARRAPDLPRGDRAGPGARTSGMNFVGLLHAGPTLIAEATPTSRRRFHLPGILKGEHVWCQGFCEPERRAATSPACAPAPCATATTT